MRVCLTDGRRLASQLSVGIDKGELMGLCSEAEVSATQLRDLYTRGLVRSKTCLCDLYMLTLTLIDGWKIITE